MGGPAAQLAPLLAEGAMVEEVVGCKVTGNLQLLAPLLVLNKTATAPTFPGEGLKATLDREVFKELCQHVT